MTPEPDRTEPLDTHLVRELRRSAAPAARVALLVAHRAGMTARELSPGVGVTIGREPPADVCVDDPKLSRVHARVVLGADLAHVEIEDLGSTNGTWVGGRRVERASVPIGAAVSIGASVVRVRRVVAPEDWQERGDAASDEGLVLGPGMVEVMRMVRRVAASPIPAILHGETGSGKEVVARRIHELGPRREAPMLSVNCGAIPKDLVESTFFGHERGAFTGAQEAKKGVFEAASGGTVFLDEIGELPAAAQAALLRVLETRRVVRVGGTREVPVDVRVIAATHKDLARMAETGEFRADLYFRLGAVTIEIPPLRARRDDIEPLARHFLRAACALHGRDAIDIAPRALERLRAWHWPGNARELRNVIDRAVVLTEAEVIDEADLPERLRGEAPPPVSSMPVATAGSEPERAAPARGENLRARVTEYERDMIREALAEAGGSRAEAAKRLGMPLRTLAHRIKVLGIEE